MRQGGEKMDAQIIHDNAIWLEPNGLNHKHTVPYNRITSKFHPAQ